MRENKRSTQTYFDEKINHIMDYLEGYCEDCFDILQQIRKEIPVYPRQSEPSNLSTVAEETISRIHDMGRINQEPLDDFYADIAD